MLAIALAFVSSNFLEFTRNTRIYIRNPHHIDDILLAFQVLALL